LSVVCVRGCVRARVCACEGVCLRGVSIFTTLKAEHIHTKWVEHKTIHTHTLEVK